MSTNIKSSELATLELYRVSLENSLAHEKIAATMDEYGYDATQIGQGKTLYAAARAAYDLNKTESDEEMVAYKAFDAKRAELQKIYSEHRKKAKVAFRNDALTAERLLITGTLPQAYLNWLQTVRKFYEIALAETEIQDKLKTLKIDQPKLAAAQALIPEMEALRNDYLVEKGESQDATQAKDAAFARIDKWMGDFYAVAKIAMAEQPQLLEVLGLTVKR